MKRWEEAVDRNLRDLGIRTMGDLEVMFERKRLGERERCKRAVRKGRLIRLLLYPGLLEGGGKMS